MQNYPSKKQESQLQKLWMQFAWGDTNALEELAVYYVPKLTTIAFKYLKEISVARKIAGEVFSDQLLEPAQNTKSISKKMMEAVRHKSLAYLKEEGDESSMVG